MKPNCPYCKQPLDLLEIFHEGDLSAIIRMQPAFGKHAGLVWEYCGLFGVSPLRLKAGKLRLLLEEMKRLFDGESFAFDRKIYGISHAGIAEALDVMVKRNFDRNLPNHNYLKQIMIGISEREGKAAGKTAEKNLKKREKALMTEIRDDDYSVPEEQVQLPPAREVPRPAGLTDEQIEANKTQLKKLMGTLGGGAR